MLTAITGINWGDEGKGRMVDLISQEYDIVARYQGGNNAGHTVKNERGKFVLNLLPSGILRPNVVCVMGNGMVIDPHHLDGEINLSLIHISSTQTKGIGSGVADEDFLKQFDGLDCTQNVVMGENGVDGKTCLLYTSRDGRKNGRHLRPAHYFYPDSAV